MFQAPERSAERDAAIEALLPNVPFDGWTVAALRAAAGPDADLLFPGGAVDMIEAYCDLGDRWMEQGAGAALDGLRVSQRVRALIALRFEQNRPHKDAVRRALGVLAVPGNAGVAVRCTARTVDAIWHAAGDGSADFSWYSKRAILAGVYGVTLLFWLTDSSEDDARTLAFLDRKLAAVGSIGGLRRRIGGHAGPGPPRLSRGNPARRYCVQRPLNPGGGDHAQHTSLAYRNPHPHHHPVEDLRSVLSGASGRNGSSPCPTSASSTRRNTPTTGRCIPRCTG